MKGYEIIRKDLLKLRESLLKDIGTNLKTERNPGDREVGDFYDDVDIEKDRQMVYTLGERERAKLNAINSALEKIEDGTYGECEECGEEINKKRLKIIPFAKFCINCQSDHEKRAVYTEEPAEDNLLYKDISMSDLEGGDE
ncbi:MAG: TraR/DksA family transcriptional regulator [Proteobacteria bacterium]|jgi:DnaK suppressor protein|nr:TraR/DksA family transcriptional regulator [Pseudomonadota bacterium]